MRRLSRALVLCALSLSVASSSGCKRTQTSSDTSPGTTGSDEGKTSTKPERARRKPGLPRPLRLPANAPIIVHIQSPGDALAGLRAYAPELPVGRKLLQDAVAQTPNTGELEQKLAAFVDLERPWDAASVDGQLIVHVPILKNRVQSVATLLADKPPVGKFGAVDLQRATSPTLAWLDEDSSSLTLADTERGLATGRHLARQYGKDQPLRLELQGAETRKYTPQFALEQLTLGGAGTHDFEMSAKGVPPEVFARLDQLQPGALTGLLDSPRIAVGASSKYANYDEDVRQLMGNLKRQVDRQNFLVRGTLEDLLRRFGATVRSWNGRTMVAVGPENHILLGMGADDPKKMGGAAFHLVNGLIDNLDLARSIGVSVPKIRFKRNRGNAAGSNISVFVLQQARKYLPPEAAPLMADNGDLRIAVAFPNRAGAGMIVLGPDSQNVLGAWLEDVADATPASESGDDFIAATVAVEPAQIEPLLAGGGNPAALLGLSATRDPTKVTVVRDGDTVTLRVNGPKVGFRPRRIGTRVGRPGAGDQPARGPARTPAGGKPARIDPSRGKPIQKK